MTTYADVIRHTDYHVSDGTRPDDLTLIVLPTEPREYLRLAGAAARDFRDAWSARVIPAEHIQREFTEAIAPLIAEQLPDLAAAATQPLEIYITFGRIDADGLHIIQRKRIA